MSKQEGTIPLREIAGAYLRVGATAFGGPAMLPQLRRAALRRGWLTDHELDEGLALVQLYPGPIGVDLVAYIGFKLRGVPGAVVAATGFLLPSFVFMVLLSAVYFTAGTLPWVSTLFRGLEALVVGMLLHLALDLGSRNLRNPREAMVGFTAFAALLFHVNALVIVLVALALGALVLRPEAAPGNPGRPRALARAPGAPRRWLGIGAVVAGVVGGALSAWALGSTVGSMGLVFFKIGSVAFGNGTTILPLIQADVVDARHWLTMNQFADGIALGQITPGPFLITAAFIGYKLGGVGAAALATFAMFAPSFAMTLVFTELFARVKDLGPARGALAGVMASFAGMVAVMVLQLGDLALKGPSPLVLAAGGFVGVRFLKLDAAWVLGGGLALWAAASAAGLA